jgi:hypothetical protein
MNELIICVEEEQKKSKKRIRDDSDIDSGSDDNNVTNNRKRTTCSECGKIGHNKNNAMLCTKHPEYLYSLKNLKEQRNRMKNTFIKNIKASNNYIENVFDDECLNGLYIYWVMDLNEKSNIKLMVDIVLYYFSPFYRTDEFIKRYSTYMFFASKRDILSFIQQLLNQMTNIYKRLNTI